MAAQKVVISKDLKADLQAFFASMSYDKLFILTDTNTQEKCYPLIKDIPALQDTPVITVQAGDTHKDIEQVAYCLLYTSPSPRDRSLSRMPSSA